LFHPSPTKICTIRTCPTEHANNPNLKIYSEAIAQVAKDKSVLFVDLFTPSLELYAKSSKPLTIDGVHLSDMAIRFSLP